MPVYQIMHQIEDIIDQATVDESTGEVMVDFARLETLEIQQDQKVEELIKAYINTSALRDMFEVEINDLKKRKHVLENKADSIAKFLEGFPAKRYNIHQLSYRKSKTVVGNNIASLPDEMIKTTHAPNKTEIRNALINGVQLDGWSLVEKNNLQIQ